MSETSDAVKDAVPYHVRYWEERKDFLYYQAVRILVSNIGKDATSIIDVGSAGCPYLDWFPDVPLRTSVDLHKPYKAKGITSYRGDFLTWPADRAYDVAMCLQVMEHVPDAKAFAQKLLSTAKVVVVSVPYKWKKGSTKSHVHDPVDESKMRVWFGREPNYSYICKEIRSDVSRLIQVYDELPKKWSSIKSREKISELHSI